MAFPIERILFLCVANSARSQLAEALTRHHLGARIRAQSAGSAPSRVSPAAIEVLQELGVSTEGLTSKHVDTIDPASVDLVITLCAEEECPVFLADVPRISWQQPDPDRKHEVLSDEQRRVYFRVARDNILARVDDLRRGILDTRPGLPALRLHQRGFLEINNTGVEALDIEIAEQTIARANALLDEVSWPLPYVLLVNMGAIRSIPREARARFAEPDARIAKQALLANGPLTRVMGNFFIKLQRPAVCSQVFNDHEKAVRWLLE